MWIEQQLWSFQSTTTSFFAKQEILTNVRMQHKILDISSLSLKISAVGFKPWCICVCVHAVCLYQTAELEQSRRTSSMIIESGRVSMGTGASLPPQVFVIVNSVKTLVTVSFRALSVVLLSRLGTAKRFNKVHLVLEKYKPPAEQNGNFRVEVSKGLIFFFSISDSQNDLSLTNHKTAFVSHTLDTNISFAANRRQL